MAITTSRPILIVDDDPGIRRVLRIALEEEGYQAVTVWTSFLTRDVDLNLPVTW